MWRARAGGFRSIVAGHQPVGTLGGDAVGRRWQPLAAYVSLVAMDFRGFRQFGVIGRLGMVLCWIAPFLLAPSLIAWLDKGRLRRSASGRRVYGPWDWLAIASRALRAFRRGSPLGAHAAGSVPTPATSAATNWSSDLAKASAPRYLGSGGKAIGAPGMDKFLGRQVTPI